jgi:hypothetical protein
MKPIQGVAVATIEIAERVTARDLYRLVGLVENVYSWHVLLDHLEVEEIASPDIFLPPDDEVLVVNRLEVGTPNFVELAGLIRPLVDTIAWIGGVGGAVTLANSVVTVVKSAFEVKKIFWETKKIELEVEKARREGRAEERPLIQLVSVPDPIQRTRSSPAALKAFSEDDLRAKAIFMDYATQTVSELFPRFAAAPILKVFAAGADRDA